MISVSLFVVIVAVDGSSDCLSIDILFEEDDDKDKVEG